MTFGIPNGFSSQGIGLCINNAIPTVMTNTVPHGTAVSVVLDAGACTLTYNIPQGKPGSLIKSTAELAGAICKKGGQKIEVGLDSNDNNTLDASEITSTNYVCGA